MVDSRYIPAEVRRAVLMESGHSCAVPTCPLPADELHHIKPFAEGGEHTVENLIALCRNHHGWVHDGIIDTKAVKAYKEQLKQYQPKLAQVQAELAEMRGKIEAVPGLVMENEQLKARIAVLEERTAQAKQGEGRESLVQRGRQLLKADELFEAGVKFAGREQYPKALEYFVACRSVEETWDVLGNLGVVYSKLERYDEALAAYDRVEELRREQGLPEDTALAKNRGVVFVNLGRYKEALAAYDKAKQLRREQGLPEDADLATNRGVVYWYLRQYKEALVAYDLAEKLRREQGLPEDADLATNRGVVFVNLGKHEEALAAYDKAKQLRREQGLPENWQLVGNRGVVYYSLGRYEEALFAYDTAEKLRREQGLLVDPTITFNKAHVYKAQGDLKAACQLACQARDMYAEHRLQAPISQVILDFIKDNCSNSDECA